MIMMLTDDKKHKDHLRHMSAIFRERQSLAYLKEEEREYCRESIQAIQRALEVLDTQVYA